jgi:hypothetical protein
MVRVGLLTLITLVEIIKMLNNSNLRLLSLFSHKEVRSLSKSNRIIELLFLKIYFRIHQKEIVVFIYRFSHRLHQIKQIYLKHALKPWMCLCLSLTSHLLRKTWIMWLHLMIINSQKVRIVLRTRQNKRLNK